MTMDLSDLRRSYTQAGLLEADVDPDPFRQFALWMGQAIDAQLLEPNAMTLATANASGQPNARTVLLKGFDPEGLIFYTNYESCKGAEILANPKVSLLFYWGPLERQVRILGVASNVSEEVSNDYFANRPTGHQMAAWVSKQSNAVAGREELQERLNEVEHRFKDSAAVPRPAYWGGYRVSPQTFEFWQGRPNRLHDRLEYTRSGDAWGIRRLAP